MYDQMHPIVVAVISTHNIANLLDTQSIAS